MIKEPIILTVCYDAQDRNKESYYLDGDDSRSCGILRFSHEYSVYLKKDLTFEYASSIDCGETSEYEFEEEFEASYPGVLKAIRDAAAAGTLRIRRYKWNKDLGRNEEHILPYPEEA